MSRKNQNTVAIVTMILLFGMISFVTNLAAPVGNIWKHQPGIEGSNALGIMGNMMNFLAYLFMGIPAGRILNRLGSKKTILIAISVGFSGVFIQFLSGIIGVGISISDIPANYFVYLAGAFVSGFSVCMLNTVVNPMLTLLGGEKRGNQYIQMGGTCNSLMGTITPILVGSLIGQITKDTFISDVNPVLYIAMGVFAAAFIILSFIPLSDPEEIIADTEGVTSPLKFRHFVLGAAAIFMYVGVEVGIPGTLNFFLSDVSEKGGRLDPRTATAIAGFVEGTYWFMMFIGRLIGSVISGKVSSRTQLTAVTLIAMALVVCAIFTPVSSRISMPVFTGSGFAMAKVPVSALLLVCCGLCTCVMWGSIFDLAVRGLGKSTVLASGIFMTMVVGGGILPLAQNILADATSYMTSYWVVIAGLAFINWYAVKGSRPVISQHKDR